MTISDLGSIGQPIAAAATVATFRSGLLVRANTNIAKYNAINDIINRVINESRICRYARFDGSMDSRHQKLFIISIEDQVRFTSVAVENATAIEGPSRRQRRTELNLRALQLLGQWFNQLMRNKGVREHWELRKLICSGFCQS